MVPSAQNEENGHPECRPILIHVSSSIGHPPSVPGSVDEEGAAPIASGNLIPARFGHTSTEHIVIRRSRCFVWGGTSWCEKLGFGGVPELRALIRFGGQP